MTTQAPVRQIEQEIDSLAKRSVELHKYLIENHGSKFRSSYQDWYTSALGVVRSLLPDRLPEFQRMYHMDRRKEITYATYTVEDYLFRVVIMRGLGSIEEFSPGSAAAAKFAVQAYILQSARLRLTEAVANIRGLLQADLFDSELDAARHLAKNGHVRAAGAVAGVVLEGHLAEVCDNHGVKVPKKAPHIGDFNEALKNAGVFDVAQWRRIQSLADTRNLCDHKKKRDPTSQEVDDLMDGVDKAIKTLT